MNCAQFKDPVSHMCLTGAVVVSKSLTQDMAGSSPFTVMTNIFSKLCETFRKRNMGPGNQAGSDIILQGTDNIKH